MFPILAVGALITLALVETRSANSQIEDAVEKYQKGEKTREETNDRIQRIVDREVQKQPLEDVPVPKDVREMFASGVGLNDLWEARVKGKISHEKYKSLERMYNEGGDKWCLNKEARKIKD